MQEESFCYKVGFSHTDEVAEIFQDGDLKSHTKKTPRSPSDNPGAAPSASVSSTLYMLSSVLCPLQASALCFLHGKLLCYLTT